MTLDRKIKWLFGLIVLANVIIVLVVALGAFEPPPPKPLPDPNGYDDFVKAGKLWIRPETNWTELSNGRLSAYVSTNEPVLKILRAGLSHECRVPDDYSKDYLMKFIVETTPIRYTGQLLCAQGRLAEIEHRTNDAAQSFLEDIQLGEHWTRGGVMICKLIGMGSEYDGRRELEPLLDKLDAENCRKVARTLEIVDAREEPLANFLHQEKLWQRKSETLSERLLDLIHKEPHTDDFEKNFHTNQLLRRQMMIDFAAHAYELEKGKPPASSTNLVPDYLKAVPHDPGMGSNLALRAGAP